MGIQNCKRLHPTFSQNLSVSILKFKDPLVIDGHKVEKIYSYYYGGSVSMNLSSYSILCTSRTMSFCNHTIEKDKRLITRKRT